MKKTWRKEHGTELGYYVPSPKEVLAARTGKGARTRAILAQWGVPWPPPKGWRAELERLYNHQQEERILTKHDPKTWNSIVVLKYGKEEP